MANAIGDSLYTVLGRGSAEADGGTKPQITTTKLLGPQPVPATDVHNITTAATGAQWYIAWALELLCSAALPIDIPKLVGPGVLVTAPAQGSFTRAEILAALPRATALIATLDLVVDEELLAAAPLLRVVANHAVGFDNVDVAAATRRKIVVTNTPGVLTEATADFTWALLLAASRRIVEADCLARSGTWAGWHPSLLLGDQVFGQRLGIIGLGRIGKAVARRARGFDMRVMYAGPRRVPDDHEFGARRASLEELLQQSDFVSLHCPATPQTSPVLTRSQLSRMKSGAIVVNTARGTCIDEEALMDALDEGVIGGAALDVFASEPAIPARLRDNPRVTLAPHVGSATWAARSAMGRLCVQAAVDVLSGKVPGNIVNPEVVS